MPSILATVLSDYKTTQEKRLEQGYSIAFCLMKKAKVMYCLTTRGLYSELFNLCLATVYCEKMGYELCINSYYWNAKIEKGWNDYFESVFKCYNNYFSAQDKIYTKEKPWIGKIYYKPREFFTFYASEIANSLYLLLHPHTLLTKDIFERMRSDKFINDILGDNAFALMAESYKKMYHINSITKQELSKRKLLNNLPDDYIGLHIRRGDKIVSKEMNDIHLNRYVDEALKHRDLSSNVFVATDDVTVVDYMRPRFEDYGMKVFYNKLNKSRGHNEATFNQSSKQFRYEETINVLLEMDILTHSRYFIGTYTSNLSRVVPFYLGLNKCTSLDNDWNIINSMNGM